MLTVAQAAAQSGLSIAYIRAACQRGALPANKVGVTYQFTEEAFALWLTERRKPGNPQWSKGGVDL